VRARDSESSGVRPDAGPTPHRDRGAENLAQREKFRQRRKDAARARERQASSASRSKSRRPRTSEQVSAQGLTRARVSRLTFRVRPRLDAARACTSHRIFLGAHRGCGRRANRFEDLPTWFSFSASQIGRRRFGRRRSSAPRTARSRSTWCGRVSTNQRSRVAPRVKRPCGATKSSVLPEGKFLPRLQALAITAVAAGRRLTSL
jgi:hypothetical protein